jgi:membrane protease YdiL (CAAX protease family)
VTSLPRGAAPPEARGVGQVYLLYIVSLLLVLTLGAAAQMISVPLGIAFTEVVCILAPAIAYVRFKGLPLRQALGLRPVPPSILLLAALVGVSGFGVTIGIYFASVPVLGEGPKVPDLIPRDRPHLLLVMVCASLLPGICEEVLFRGAIQGTLRRLGDRKAVILTALLFAAFHLNPWSFLPILFVGAVLGTVTVRAASTIPAVVAHAALDATSLNTQSLLAGRAQSSYYPLIGVMTAVFAVALPMLLIRSGAGRSGFTPASPSLATVPAGLPRRVALTLAVTVAMAIALAIVAFTSLVAVYPMPSDDLAPDFRRGDQVVVLKSRFVAPIEPSNVVAYSQGKETRFGRVARIDATGIWVVDGAGQRPIPRRDVIGKVVHRIGRSD